MNRSIFVRIVDFRLQDVIQVTGISNIEKNEIYPALDDNESDKARVCIKGKMHYIKRHWLHECDRIGGCSKLLALNPQLSVSAYSIA